MDATRKPAALLAAVAVFIAISASGVCAAAPFTEDTAIVDMQRLLRDSVPAKAAEAHMAKVREVLQKGLTEMNAAYKNQASSPEIQAQLREGQAVLERQLEAERQAVLKILIDLTYETIREWRAANPKCKIVLNREQVLDSDSALDITDAVMASMKGKNLKFPALPTVTVNTPPAPADKK